MSAIDAKESTVQLDNGHADNDQHAPASAAADAVREGIVSRLSGVKAIDADIVIVVKATVADALKAGGSAAHQLTKLIHDVVRGAIQAVEQLGLDLATSMKSVAKGIVLGVHEVGGDVITASAETAHAIILHVASVGVDAGTAARRAAEGSIEGVGRISKLAIKTIKDVALGVSDGIGQVVGAVLPVAVRQHVVDAAPASANSD
ncbi:hypothetical protein [Herbaspirillum sp. ST 5-3]|uniref:hypothetical protein n=1 Tax=Oxalobacteraceae TaxID=75682 RepID=UPI0010A2C067|nr:hypothetical protein [Herbaspirillum sp. ST 5-3]